MIRALYDLSFEYLNDLSLISKISKLLGVSLTRDYRSRDILIRSAICDFDGVARLTGVQRKKVERISMLLNHEQVRISEILGTRDTRVLRRDILEAFAVHASCKIASNVIRSILPTILRDEVERRQKFVIDAQNVYSALKENGILQDVRVKLKDFNIEVKGINEITAVDYIYERLKAMSIASEIDKLFRGSGISASLLNEQQLTAANHVIDSFASVAKGEMPDPESLLNDEELLISEELQSLRNKGGDPASIIERHVSKLSDLLGLNRKEEAVLRNAAFSSVSLPFTFDRSESKRLLGMVKDRLQSEMEEKMKKLNQTMMTYVNLIDEIAVSVLRLDVALALAEISDELSLKLPELGSREDGISFIKGMNFFLLLDRAQRERLMPVSYSIGRDTIGVGARQSNVVMLTGANSGGKTTLLITVASIAMLTSLGLPVPAERCKAATLPVYLFRRKTSRKIGSLEHALRSLRPVFATRQRKIILMDEFEALTEPGAAGRILASIVNHIAPTSSLLLLVTHLSRETLPHIRFRIRVDGIQASGLNEMGELQVERQPKFDQVGSSTPQLVIMKLIKSKKRGARENDVYRNMLHLLGEKGEDMIQAPIAIPWVEGND